MNDPVKGFEILIDTIENNRRHQDYNRVTELADLYFKLFTGEDVASLLERFTPREDDKMFEQRQKLYNSVMPAVASNLSNVYNKPLRSNRVFSSYTYDKKNDKAIEELRTLIKNFWQGESDSGVDAYLRSRWADLAKHDPNAFMIVDFEGFDAKLEKAKPYPVEYSSQEAINYQYKNGVLQWLIVVTESTFKKKTARGKEEDVKGASYIIYLENDAISLIEVDWKDPVVGPDDEIYKIESKKRAFIVNRFAPKGGRVPAVRVGCVEDPRTKGRTSLSLFHPAVSFFKKELKSGSELDITMSLHTFPQKVQYAQRCNGDKERGIPPCRSGVDVNGTTCPVCNGTGMSPVHTSGQDILYVPLPKPGEPMVDLDKILVYKFPPVELIKVQDEYVDRLTEKARKAIFGGTSMTQKAGVKTATEMDYSMDDVYDALRPFADKYSAMWMFFVAMIATFTDNNKDLKLYHRFPNDFKMKSLQSLFEERKAAVDSGVPQYIVDAIDVDIMEIIYADDHDTLTKIQTKARFMPFGGKSADEIQTILIQNRTTKYYSVLYTHFEMIFEAIDMELADDFYLMSYEQQKKELEKRVDTLIQAMADEKSSRMPVPIEKDQLN